MDMIKAVLVGKRKVGKTSILNRLVNGRFQTQYKSTIAIDFLITTLPTTSIQIWDAGQIQSTFAKIFFKNAHVIISVFDLSDQQSFQQCIRLTQYALSNIPTATLIFLGNQADMQKSVDPHWIQQIEQKWGCKCMEVSAKNGLPREEIMKQIIRVGYKGGGKQGEDSPLIQVKMGSLIAKDLNRWLQKVIDLMVAVLN